MVKFLDCTTRDGGHCTNWNYSDEYIFNLMSKLNTNKVSFYEIGYRNFINKDNKGAFYYCTPDMLKKFYDKKGSLKLGIMVDTKRYKEEDFTDGKRDYTDFVRIATHPDKIEATLLIAEKLYNKNYNVMIQLMDISGLSEENYKLLKRWEHKDIPETIYLADTYGVLKPEDINKHYNRLKEYGYKNISFHAHNQTKHALQNTLKSIELGAYSVDFSQDGKGINGGNLSFEYFCEYVNEYTK